MDSEDQISSCRVLECWAASASRHDSHRRKRKEKEEERQRDNNRPTPLFPWTRVAPWRKVFFLLFLYQHSQHTIDSKSRPAAVRAWDAKVS